MLGYLLSPTIQLEDVNGIPLVGGKIYVYKANTTTPAVTYSDFAGNMNTNPIILDSIGHATVIADDTEMFDIEVRKADDTFLFSSKLVGVNQGGSGTVSNVTVQPGFGILVNESIADNVVTFTVSADTNFMATKSDLNGKQDILIPGSNIDITDNTISVTGLAPYSAGANIDITNHVVSGKDWSNDILTATTGKIDKVTGGAGSETNPVYLDASNVIQPCFSGSVKLAETVPHYFSADAGSNIMLYAPNGSHKTSGDSIRNSVFITNYDNYLANTTTDKYENCIFMGNCYMYSPNNAGTCSYEDNIIIGNNSISLAQSNTICNTVIGTHNDLLGDRGASSHKFQTTTVVGYQNNAYTDTYATTIVGSNNDVGNYESSAVNNKEVQVSIFGDNNEFTYDSTDSLPTHNFIVGVGNNVVSRVNYKCAAVGFDNNLTGNCTLLFGDGLTATNEGSYEDKIMKVGFGNCHFEIHSSGTVYNVVNGTKRPYYTIVNDGTVGTATNTIYII